MWIFVLSDAIGSIALLATLVALAQDHPNFSPQSLHLSIGKGLIATAFLVGVSTCLILASRVSSRYRSALVFSALLFALTFCAWHSFELQTHAYRGQAMESFLVASIFHGLHVAAGTIALGLSLRKRSSLAPLSLYWHFLGVLWLGIFAFFYLQVLA